MSNIGLAANELTDQTGEEKISNSNRSVNLIKLNVYENDKINASSQREKKIRNKNAYKGMKATQKKHHTGPIKTQFVKDSLGRAKTKLVRKATLFKKAKELFCTTNLDVAVMVLDSKKIDSFFTPNGMLENKIFKNLSTIMPNTIATTSAVVTQTSVEDEEEEDECLQIKKVDAETQVEHEDKTEYDRTVCSICNVKISSKLDRIPSPFLNYGLLKCQRGLCGYTVHNFCVGLGLECEKNIQKLKFLCPKHTYDV